MRYNPLKSNIPCKPRPLAKGTLPQTTEPPRPTLTENDRKDGFELRFPKPPGEAILARFHASRQDPDRANHWHWHFRKKFWYAKRTTVTRAFAEETLRLVSQEPGPAAEPPAPAAPPSNIVPVAFAPMSAMAEPSYWRDRVRRRP